MTGTPAVRSAGRLMWWLIRRQRWRVAAGVTLGTLWMVGLTLPPYLLSQAINGGLHANNAGALIVWVAALFVVGVLNAALAVMRHRTMTKIRMDAAFRMIRTIVAHSTKLGTALNRQVTSGEVVTIGMNDVGIIAMTLTITGPGVGAVIAYIVIAVELYVISPVLALVVLLGVPVLAILVGPLLSRLQKVGAVYRENQGALSARLVDIVAGLRVLGGLGGKETYAGRYRRDSQALRREGYRVGAVTSWIQALGVGLPMLFLAVVTWLAARMAAQGQINIGQLAAVYGYVAVLVVPVSIFIECGFDLIRGLVSARRVVAFLNLAADSGGSRAETPETVDAPASPAMLRDPDSGVELMPATFGVIATARTADAAAVVDRLGGFASSATTWGGVRLDDITTAHVRDRILVADNEADLFSGPMRELIAGRWDRDDQAIMAAVGAAAAEDVVRGLPDGLDTVITSQGRNLSGGQRQRVRLARALLAAPEILLAVEPTSAVDAHTEAAMVTGLRAFRSGRTTLVASTSPLVADQADAVFFLVDGHVAATGHHRDLLREHPGYQALVARDINDEVTR